MFGPAEYFWLFIFGLTIIAGASTKSMTKGLTFGALGLMISTIGMDPMLGNFRFTFGIPVLCQSSIHSITYRVILDVSSIFVVS